MIKKITKKTILKQIVNGEEITFKSFEKEGVFYWTKKNIYPGDIVVPDIIAQSEPKIDGVPVVSLDSYYPKFVNIITDMKAELNNTIDLNAYSIGAIESFRCNPNKYTLADIEKAMDLARVNNVMNNNDVYFQYKDTEIIDKINSIQSITVDSDFNIVKYE